MQPIAPEAAGFLENMGSAAAQVAVLFILAGVGFAADRLGVYTEKTARATNDLLFYVITPCVIIGSFLGTQFSAESAAGFFIALAISFAAHAIGIVYAAPLFNKSGENAAIYKFACAYGNVGYMALPLADAVLGAQGVFLCSGGVIALNTLAFTHGVWLMNKGGRGAFRLSSLILNPGVISVLIGLPLFIFSVKLPKLAAEPIEFISGLNTPLAMIIFGTYISHTDLKSLFKLRCQYPIAAVRLIAVPLTVLLLCTLASLPAEIKTACMISAAAPSANNTVMFSAKYGKSTAVASEIVAFNSFASILTLPIMIALAQI